VSFSGTRGSMFDSRLPRGMWRAPGIAPWSYSSGSRTSSTTVFGWLRSSSAAAVSISRICFFVCWRISRVTGHPGIKPYLWGRHSHQRVGAVRRWTLAARPSAMSSMSVGSALRITMRAPWRLAMGTTPAAGYTPRGAADREEQVAATGGGVGPNQVSPPRGTDRTRDGGRLEDAATGCDTAGPPRRRAPEPTPAPSARARRTACT